MPTRRARGGVAFIGAFRFVSLTFAVAALSLSLINFYMIEKSPDARVPSVSLTTGQLASFLNYRKPITNRETLFMGIEHHTLAYSGMWWMRGDLFQRMPVENITYLEHASFMAFETGGTNAVAMTVDFLDFSVEHISKFIEHFVELEKPHTRAIEFPFRSLSAMLRKYQSKVKHSSVFDDQSRKLGNETLAIVRLFETDPGLEDWSETIAYLDDSKSPDTREEQLAVIQMHVLASTLVSLQQIGMGRAIVMGRQRLAPAAVKAAFAIVRQNAGSRKDAMEMVYVCAFDAMQPTNRTESFWVPRFALERVQRALAGRLSEIEARAILGSDPSRSWRYMYYTDSDLILHTRPEALRAIRGQLEKGRVMAAHRMQHLPHRTDFPSHDEPGIFLPNIGSFALFHDLDPAHDACCYASKDAPGKDVVVKHPCNSLWHHCGFSHWQKDVDPMKMYVNHHRLWPYPMIRYIDGLGVPVVSNHGQVCVPVKNGVCEPSADLIVHLQDESNVTGNV